MNKAKRMDDSCFWIAGYNKKHPHFHLFTTSSTPKPPPQKNVYTFFPGVRTFFPGVYTSVPLSLFWRRNFVGCFNSVIINPKSKIL
jgi:hypothetical protein